MDVLDYASIINPRAVAVDVAAANKEEAFQSISELLAKDGVVTDIDAFKRDLYYRESLGSTGIGGGVAIPHGKSLAVSRTCISVVKLKEPIAWESADGKPVQVLILFAVNDADKGNTFLRMMAQVARKLAKEETSKKLVSAKTPEELMAVLG